MLSHLIILFVQSNTLYAALAWRPTATLNETALGSFAAQNFEPQKDVKLEMLSHGRP